MILRICPQFLQTRTVRAKTIKTTVATRTTRANLDRKQTMQRPACHLKTVTVWHWQLIVGRAIKMSRKAEQVRFQLESTWRCIFRFVQNLSLYFQLILRQQASPDVNFYFRSILGTNILTTRHIQCGHVWPLSLFYACFRVFSLCALIWGRRQSWLAKTHEIHDSVTIMGGGTEENQDEDSPVYEINSKYVESKCNCSRIA